MGRKLITSTLLALGFVLYGVLIVWAWVWWLWERVGEGGWDVTH